MDPAVAVLLFYTRRISIHGWIKFIPFLMF